MTNPRIRLDTAVVAAPGSAPATRRVIGRGLARGMRRGCLAASVQVFTLIGCQQAQPIVDVWFFEGTHGFRDPAAREMSPAGIEWRTRRVELAGALGETLSCRFAVRSADAVDDPDFRVARFRSVDAV